MSKYAFLLWREPLLSLAELESIFSDVKKIDNFAIIECDREVIEKYRNSLGWTIKIALIHAEGLKKNDLLPLVIEKIREKTEENKKLRIGIDVFTPSLSSLVFKAKDAIKSQWFSIRVVQHDNGRTKTATTIHEKLIEQGLELVIYPDGNWFTLAETIWIQDIESYSQRDMDRDRSMVVGMMPPKIAQIMINLATKGSTDVAIWDPFCGLGTTLIEAFHSGFTDIIWSDIEVKMAEATKKNIEHQKGIERHIETFVLDAKKIDTHVLTRDTVIVTEWMLGRNFTTSTITQQAAFQERKDLTELYSGFLSASYKNRHIKNMVFCLPFWNIWTETLFMPEISSLSRDWSVDNLCMRGKRYITHMRPGQCVGREIIILKR
jgi:tRNA G10  N-methylase Trm11